MYLVSLRELENYSFKIEAVSLGVNEIYHPIPNISKPEVDHIVKQIAWETIYIYIYIKLRYWNPGANFGNEDQQNIWHEIVIPSAKIMWYGDSTMP